MQSHIVGNVSSPWPLGENLYHHTPIHTAFDSVNGSGAVHGTVSFGSGNDSFYEYLLKSHLIMPHDNPQLYVELYRRLTRQLNFEYGRVNDHAATQGTFQLLFEHRGRLFLSRHPGRTYHEQLACFLPGLMMLGAMMLPDRATALDQIIAEKLLDGCLWTYNEPSISRHGLGADLLEAGRVRPARTLARFRGLISATWVSTGTPSRLRVRALSAVIESRPARDRRSSWDRSVVISDECVAEIRWWVTNIARVGRSPITPRPIEGALDGFIFSDASDSGVGAVLFAEGPEAAASSLVAALHRRCPPGMTAREVIRYAQRGLEFVAPLPPALLSASSTIR